MNFETFIILILLVVLVILGLKFFKDVIFIREKIR